MNKIQHFAVLLLLSVTTAAVADFRTINRAHEIKPSELRLPASSVGSLAFRKCDDCDLTTLRVNANTHYVVNGESVDLRAVRSALLRARSAPEMSPVIVVQNLETDFAISVKISL